MDVDAYLRWEWQRGPRAPGTHPLTVDDFLFDAVRFVPDLTRSEVVEMFTDAAERVREQFRKAA